MPLFTTSTKYFKIDVIKTRKTNTYSIYVCGALMNEYATKEEAITRAQKLANSLTQKR